METKQVFTSDIVNLYSVARAEGNKEICELCALALGLKNCRKPRREAAWATLSAMIQK